MATFFDLYSLTNYSARIVARRLLRRKYDRSPAAVSEEYAATRQRYLDQWRRSPPPLEHFLISEADDNVGNRYHQLIDGRLVTGALREARSRLMERLVQVIST